VDRHSPEPETLLNCWLVKVIALVALLATPEMVALTGR